MCSRRSLGIPFGGVHSERGWLSTTVSDPADPALDLADRVQVLVDLAAVAGAQLGLELPGIIQDVIENALLVTLLPELFGGRTLSAARTE